MFRAVFAAVGSLVGMALVTGKQIVDNHVAEQRADHRRCISKQRQFVEHTRSRSDNIARDYAEPLARVTLMHSRDRLRETERAPITSFLRNFF